MYEIRSWRCATVPERTRKEASVGKQVIDVNDGRHKFGYLSPAVRAGDFVWVSGNAALLPKSGNSDAVEIATGGIEVETRQTIENIAATLEAAGGTLRDVVKVNTFLRDVDLHFEAYNRIYESYFNEDPPARTTVQAKILGTILIEMECIAYLPEQAV
jgi:2-iminobutanoate/2-iminopropanoate deaminase